MPNRLQVVAGLALCVLHGVDALAAGTKINNVTYEGRNAQAQSGSGPESALRLKKIFLFPAIDDLSGALAPKLDEKLVELFSSNSRFELVRDPQVVKALSPDENSYYKVAQNQSVHLEAAKVTGADTTALLRTRNIGPNTQMTLELRDSSGALIFQEEGSIPGTSSLEARYGLLEKLYGNILARLPFEGAVTGRTAATLTVDLGAGGLKQGEEIEIARIVSVQRHPLLGTVVGTDYVRTGRARVTSVDRVLSFAEITEEFPGERITPGQKILKARPVVKRISQDEPVEPEPRGPKKYRPSPMKERTEEADPFDDRLKGDFDKPKARFGRVGASLYYGSLSYIQTSSGTSRDFSGSGIGGDLNGELWVTKNWILAGGYGFHSATLSGAGSLGASTWNEFRLAGGYRIFPEMLAEGVTLTASLGYQVVNFQAPSNAGLTVGPKRYSGLFVSADGEIGLMEKQKITVGFGIQPFSSFTETGPSLGSPTGGSVIGFHLGWNTELTSDLSFLVGLRYAVANGNYENSSSVSNKRFAIGPGIHYSF